MDIIINDHSYSLPEGTTLSQALDAASIVPKGIATAVNGEVIPAPRRSSHILSPNDKILIIKAFYGG
ncbi:MAG: sulfur carrier protein ThiS [Bacteroidales bacterium]|nr:sulfur carrier protein ThiS [Bacteroidales bacterium]